MLVLHSLVFPKTDNNNLEEAKVFFLSSTMDSLHFHLLHLFECGLRTKSEVKIVDDSEMKDLEYFDPEFCRINRMIEERKKTTKTFERLKSGKNEKYNIKIKQTFKTRLY